MAEESRMDAFDSVLADVDEFGIYQRLLLAFVLLPAYIPVGFHAYNQVSHQSLSGEKYVIPKAKMAC